MIPKIIHQTAMTDETKWHPDWKRCSDTWKTYFPDWEFKIWNDEEIDSFMKINYPDIYPVFCKFPRQIFRVDMWRYYVLYHYGGMYVDMDYECFRNFESEIPDDKVAIVESPFASTVTEQVQNSLMTSPKNDKTWINVFRFFHNDCRQKLRFYQNMSWVKYSPEVLTGPIMLTRIFKGIDTSKYKIYPAKMFSGNGHEIQCENMFCKHHGTMTWAKLGRAWH